MQAYRFFSLDGAGRIRTASTLRDCKDDAAAIVFGAAVANLNGQAEVWQGTRLVGRVEKTR